MGEIPEKLVLFIKLQRLALRSFPPIKTEP